MMCLLNYEPTLLGNRHSHCAPGLFWTTSSRRIRMESMRDIDMQVMQ